MILPKKLADKIKQIHSHLDEHGELFSRAQMDKYNNNLFDQKKGATIYPPKFPQKK